MPAAAITGIGLCTPLGLSAAHTWAALMAGQHIVDHARVPVETGCVNRVTQLAQIAAEEAVLEAHWSSSELADGHTAMVIGTSKGPIDAWMVPLLHMDSSAYVVGGLDLAGLGEIAPALGDFLQLGPGPRLTISAACASGLHALIRAAVMLHSGEARRVLVVAAESSFHPLLLASYRRLGVLARPEIGCRPFDCAREGFLVSEAAAAVCLEPSDAADAIVIDRFAFAGDATHLTAAHPDGATLQWLLSSTLDRQKIDLIHAHGTGTQANDAVELAAIEESLAASRQSPLLYSHKGALGHSLGASGLISIVLNCMAHRSNQVPANVRTNTPLATSVVTLNRNPMARHIAQSIALAAGFGGASAAVTLRSRSQTSRYSVTA